MNTLPILYLLANGRHVGPDFDRLAAAVSKHDGISPGTKILDERPLACDTSDSFIGPSGLVKDC